MRDHVIKYQDPVFGRNDEIFESPPYPANRAKDMAIIYTDFLGCNVISIEPVRESG